MINYIISFTTYGDRAKYAHEAIDHIVDIPNAKVVLTVYKGDVNKLSNKLKQYIKDDKVELIVTDIDYKQHKKYIETFERYKDKPIIIIDDDVLYTRENMETLYALHLKEPDCIIAGGGCILGLDANGKLKDFSSNPYGEFDSEPSHYNVPFGYGGVIYPPGYITVNKEDCLTACSDDLLLKIYAIQNNIKVRLVKLPHKIFMNPRHVIRACSIGSKIVEQKNAMFKEYYDVFKFLEK